MPPFMPKKFTNIKSEATTERLPLLTELKNLGADAQPRAATANAAIARGYVLAASKEALANHETEIAGFPATPRQSRRFTASWNLPLHI